MSLEQLESENKIVFNPVNHLSAHYIAEAPLHFADGATDIDQKRGLYMHGPSDKSSSGIQTIRVGITSSSEGTQAVSSWIRRFNDESIESLGGRPFVDQSFPGFVRAFHCRLITSVDYNEELLTKEIEDVLRTINPNLRIRKAADLYASKVRIICRRVSRPDVIICHEPSAIEAKCGAGMTGSEKRRGSLSKEEKEEAERIRKNVESYMLLAPLGEDTRNLIEMVVNQDFRALLKAKCLEYVAPTQILTQSILEKMTIPSVSPKPGQDPSTLAWNLATAIYYKANHSPWRVGYLRPGTCFVGISFYFDKTTSDRNMHASLAQIFTDSGEGMVVRGNTFRWDVKTHGRPRLSEESAFRLLLDGVNVYKQHHNGQPPNRVVIHKSSKYDPAEKDGFIRACAEVPRFDLVALSHGRDLFFYRNGDNPVLRGTCIPLGHDSCLIYTQGYITYQRGFHKPRVPHPLEITEHYGDTPIDELAREVLALTRLNWNTADYCIHRPVTLEFSDKVGEVLGRVPEGISVKENYYYYM